MFTRTHIVALRGGLGNQLFGYAYGLHLKKTGETVKFCFVDQFTRSRELMRFLDPKDVISINEKFWRFLLRLSEKFPLFHTHFLVQENFEFKLIKRFPFVLHWGYWQDRKFFDSASEAIIAGFEKAFGYSLENKSIAGEAVIHVRRGDYVSDIGAKEILGALPISYFIEASKILYIKGFRSFRIVSDDKKWVLENLIPEIKGSYISEGDNSIIEDLQLIIQADAVVLSNSTFGWWGAVLGGSNRSTVAPSDWFTNLSSQPNLFYPNWEKIQAGR